jgi:formylglycine-generating enzyme required for sulfatase activity
VSVFDRLRSKPGGEEEKSTPLERGWTDREITNVKDDRFDFRDYAEVLAERARKAEPPLTIGLYGSWGSGKTSLMRLIEDEMQEIESIWINVWQLSNQEEVWQAFLQALFNQVNRKFPWWQRIQWGKLLRELAVNSYRIVIVIIPIILDVLIGDPYASGGNETNNQISITPVGPLTSLGLALWLLVKPVFESYREVVDFDLKSVLKYGSYKEQITELMKLQNDFAVMVEDLVGEDGRLVVFIDDLDRCTPDKIPDLLEAIKLFTTTPKCVYVLGLDHDIVRQGIFKKYRFEDKREAEEYLEKIVQVPFHLPPLDEGKIEIFIREDYPEIHKRCPTAAEVFSKGLEPNPRKVKRALNIYRTLQRLADKRTSVWEIDPINDVLLAKIVVLQNRFRSLHDYLIQDPNALMDLQRDPPHTKEDVKVFRKELAEFFTKVIYENGAINALGTLLNIGGAEFEETDIRNYIYLTGTIEGVSTDVHPSRREREALFGGDEERIRAQVAEIKGQGAEKTYIKRLRGALDEPARYTPSEVVSANVALDLLEGWEQQEFEPYTVRIPAGSFLMGSSDDDEFAELYEKPQHIVELSGYRIGKYPVTNLDYQKFVRAMDHRPPSHWEGGGYPEGMGDHPAVNVSWEEAEVYCEWLAKTTGKPYRLPTEAEWEKAARGEDGRNYPWGDEWDQSRCNSNASGIGHKTPVRQFSPHGDSPYGVADMAGNVSEWCADWYDAMTYEHREGSPVVDPKGPDHGARKVLRGGSFLNNPLLVNCTARDSALEASSDEIGFRVVIPSKIPDWQRQEINEWNQPPPEYIPVKLDIDNGLATSENYPEIKLPFSSPLFGRNEVPFELNLEEKQGALMGIEQSYPLEATAPMRSAEIKPGAKNIISAYVLVTAGNAHRVIDDIEFEAKKIGYLEFQFDEGEPYRLELELGKNIREWSYKHPDVIQTLTDFRVQQVWRDPKDEATFDMLRIDFPDPPCNVIHCQLVMDIEDIPGSYKGSLPSVRISGLTYQLDLKTLLRYDREKISALVTDIKGWGEVEDYTQRLEAVIIDYKNYTHEEIASANLALDLLEDREQMEFEPQTVRVSAGSFLMGSSDDDKLASEDEKPQHTVELSGYRIGKYPVTNREYQAFVTEKGYQLPEDWSGEGYPTEKGDHPVVDVIWEDAQAYCQWLAEKTGRDYRLPTEAEWEKAARGEQGRDYPWGDEWDASRCNSNESGIGDTTPVGQFSPQGDSPYGVADMAGNVLEWCSSLYKDYQYVADDGREDPNADGIRVLRGGAFSPSPLFVRCACRDFNFPNLGSSRIGFRVVVSPSNSDL